MFFRVLTRLLVPKNFGFMMPTAMTMTSIRIMMALFVIQLFTFLPEIFLVSSTLDDLLN